jgi:hypothetical protein
MSGIFAGIGTLITLKSSSLDMEQQDVPQLVVAFGLTPLGDILPIELHRRLQLVRFFQLFAEQRFHELWIGQLFDAQAGAFPIIKELREIISFELY